jgi:hypothetical protein
LAATYTTDNGEITAIVADLIATQCVTLRQADVTYEVLLAASENPDKNPPVKAFGLPTPAAIKINSLQDRVAGAKDFRITVDEERFRGANATRQRAIIHGLLMRLEVKHNADGSLATDDAMRPKLKMLKLDFAAGGMFDIAERYGPDAPEYAVYQALGLDRREEEA